MGALQDNPLFAGLAVFFTLCFIIGLRSFHNICPYLFSSVSDGNMPSNSKTVSS